MARSNTCLRTVRKSRARRESHCIYGAGYALHSSGPYGLWLRRPASAAKSLRNATRAARASRQCFKIIPDPRRGQGRRYAVRHAPPTQRVERRTHYHCTVKSNQPALERAIALLLETRGAPEFVEVTPPDDGRIETRRTWCASALNAYLDFPHAGKVFPIERESIE